MKSTVWSAALFVLAVSAAWSATQPPVAVSPGSPSTVPLVEARCPTFSWGEVDRARSYELVVYRIGDGGQNARPALRQTLPRSVGSWTPSLDRCLERGQQYAWSVRALGGDTPSDWSPPSLFQVASGPSQAHFEEAVAVVRQYLAAQGASEKQAAPFVAVQTGTPRAGGEAAGPSEPSALVPVSEFAVLPVGELDCQAGRYQDNGDGTVTDCRSGLVWLRDASCDSLGPNADGTANWQEAVSAAANLSSGTCGLTDGSTAGDWRLPTKTEWMAMVASALKQGFTDPALTDARGTAKWTTDGDAFVGVESLLYWGPEWTGPSDAWHVSLFSGVLDHSNKTVDNLVWPLRAGQ